MQIEDAGKLGPTLDSKEGMELIAHYARTGRFVLNEGHVKLAAKHGVCLDGITISITPDACSDFLGPLAGQH